MKKVVSIQGRRIVLDTAKDELLWKNSCQRNIANCMHYCLYKHESDTGLAVYYIFCYDHYQNGFSYMKVVDKQEIQELVDRYINDIEEYEAIRLKEAGIEIE